MTRVRIRTDKLRNPAEFERFRGFPIGGTTKLVGLSQRGIQVLQMICLE